MTQSGAQLHSPPINLLSGTSLFLDFDGTLVEFAHRPEAVVVSEQLSLLIQKLAEQLDGRLAIVSGRSAGEVRALFRSVSLAVAGSHGLEIQWPDGRMLSVPRPDQLSDVEAAMDQLANQHPGVLVERKPFGAALHYRMAPNAAEPCRDLALALAQRTGLHMQVGNMVFELKSPHADKGSAVRFFMAGDKMSGTRPIFIGDDITDEAGFAAVTKLGGVGVLVGSARTTAATYGLPDVTGTLAWLEAASAALP